MAKVMRAILVREFGDASVCKLVADAPIPEVQPNEVLIRVHAAAVNSVDTYIRSGKYTRVPQLPHTPGSDAAGIIERIGADVTKYTVGDRVFVVTPVTGTYAEYCTAQPDYIFPLPSNLSFEEGSALGTSFFTAYRALVIKGQVKANETVLIHGASGGVGIAAIQLAKALGLRVIGTASTEEGRQAVRSKGADLVFNHKQEGYLKEIANATKDNGGVDMVIEMLANVNLQSDLELLKASVGRVLVVGNQGTIDVDPRLLMTKETSVHGITLVTSTVEDFQKTHDYLQKSLQEGKFKPILGKTYPLDQAAQAHTDVIEKSGALAKLILTTT